MFIEQNAILQNLLNPIICCDRDYCINRGRNDIDLDDQRDSNRQLPYTGGKENQLKQFPGYVLAPSNIKIWNALKSVFVPIHVHGVNHVHSLTAIRQLQRYEIIFQTVLASNRHLIVSLVYEAMQLLLICYGSSGSFLWIKKKLAVFLRMVEKAFRLPYAQQELEWSLQFIEYQMVATRTLQSWPLRRVYCGRLQ